MVITPVFSCSHSDLLLRKKQPCWERRKQKKNTAVQPRWTETVSSVPLKVT